MIWEALIFIGKFVLWCLALAAILYLIYLAIVGWVVLYFVNQVAAKVVVAAFIIGFGVFLWLTRHKN